MSDASIHSHDGTCGHCGSAVKTGFDTCTGCGATWRSYITPVGSLLVATSLPIAGVCALAVAVLTHGAFGPSFFTMIAVCIGAWIYAANLRRFGWLRVG